MAGEIGHIIVDPAGERCACGLYGCLETVASGSAIARNAAQLLSLPPGDSPPVAATVYELAQQGDEIAFNIVQQASKYFSRAIQWIFMAFDVEKVVLGGGVTRAGDAFLDPVLEELSLLRKQSALAEFILDESKISLLPAGYNPGAWGALILAQELSAAAK
jgi:glucokinase